MLPPNHHQQEIALVSGDGGAYQALNYSYYNNKVFPGGTRGKEASCQCKETEEAQVPSLGWKDLLEEGMATHSSIHAWRILRIEEPGWL